MPSKNFIYWYEEIADMPTEVDGEWYDLETGFKFDPDFDYEKMRPFSAKPSFNLDDKTKSHREFAKKFGGKALTGSARQKKWAEKIRADKLSEMSAEYAKVCCDTRIADLQKSVFWIENRDLSGREIGQLMADIVNKIHLYKTSDTSEEREALKAEILETAAKLKQFSV